MGNPEIWPAGFCGFSRSRSDNFHWEQESCSAVQWEQLPVTWMPSPSLGVSSSLLTVRSGNKCVEINMFFIFPEGSKMKPTWKIDLEITKLSTLSQWSDWSIVASVWKLSVASQLCQRPIPNLTNFLYSWKSKFLWSLLSEFHAFFIIIVCYHFMLVSFNTGFSGVSLRNILFFFSVWLVAFHSVWFVHIAAVCCERLD